MARVKRGTIAHKRRKRLLKLTKGFKWGRKSKYRLAKQAMFKAWTYAFRDRKKKKGNFRALWQTQINAACRERGTTYKEFVTLLKKNKINLDRKILATLGHSQPEIFGKIVEKIKG